jgi:hypothetical protein
LPVAMINLSYLKTQEDLVMSHSLEKLYSPDEWQDFLYEKGWLALELPDTKYHPGAVIDVKAEGPTQRVSWLGRLGSYFPEYTLPVEKSDLPEISFAKGKGLDAGALLNLFGFRPGLAFGKIKKVVLTISQCGAEALDLTALFHWMKNNPEKVPADCLEQLRRESCFLVYESLIVSKGNYALYGEKNVKISLQPATLGDYLKVEGDLSYTVDEQITIEHPIIFGIKRAAYSRGGFIPV